MIVLFSKKDILSRNFGWIALIAGIAITLLQVNFFYGLLESDDIFSLQIPSIPVDSRIAEAFHDEDYEQVIELTRNSPDDSETQAVYMFYNALSKHALGQKQEAIETLNSAISILGSIDNVQRSKYSEMYYVLSMWHEEQDNLVLAMRNIDEALQLSPNIALYRMYRAELAEASGENALEEYQKLWKSATSKESRLILESKTKVEDIEYLNTEYIEGFTILLVPLNEFDSVNLTDMCLLLESKYLVSCVVEKNLNLVEEYVFDETRGQYNADNLIDELRRNYLKNWPNQIVLGITDHDIYVNRANFVFSWVQVGMESQGLGVMSTNRFERTLPISHKRDILLGRRVGIQMISAVGQMFGFERPTSPECPLAYPNSVQEFSKKSSALCESTILQRDMLSEKMKHPLVKIPPEKIVEFKRVYSQYYFD